jgi:Integrase core domain
MEECWLADRTTLRTLLRTQPHWTIRDLAQAVGRSRSWVKKWRTRLRAAAPEDDAILHSRSRARKHPPPALSQAVIDRILEIRDQPPANLQRTPGAETILYYLHHPEPASALPERLPRSSRTIWRILHQYGRIAAPGQRRHTPVERPAPLTVWQLDFKDASTVPADPAGTQQHVVEVLDTVDAGSSLVINAQPRADFTAETTLVAVAETLQEHGLPAEVMFDRDSRFVGRTGRRDFPSPVVRFWLCLGVQATVLPPRRPDLNCFVERYHRAYEEECLRVFRPADLPRVCEVTARYTYHYNVERPHQGLACGNRPPQVALVERGTALDSRPPVPAVVDPDRWVVALDGQRFVRKVTADTHVSVDDERYYIAQALVGQYVTLRVDAATREFVVEHQDQEVKRLPIKGLGGGPLPFDAYLTRMCAEARADRRAAHTVGRQLALPLAA